MRNVIEIMKHFPKYFNKAWDIIEDFFIWMVDQPISIVRGAQADIDGSSINQDGNTAGDFFIATHPLLLIIFITVTLVSALVNLILRVTKKKDPLSPYFFYDSLMERLRAIEANVGTSFISNHNPTIDGDKEKLNNILEALAVNNPEYRDYKFLIVGKKKWNRESRNYDLVDRIVLCKKTEKSPTGLKQYLHFAWISLVKSAYFYWIIWFLGYLVAAGVAGTLLTLSVTGAPITLATVLIVIGLPLLMGGYYFACNAIKSRVLKKQIIMDENQSYQQIKDDLQYEVLKSYESDLQIKRLTIINDQEQSSPNENNPSQSQNHQTLPRHTMNLIWEFIRNMIIGYTLGTFAAWFTSYALIAITVEVGTNVVAAALSATIIGIPISLAIVFIPGVIAGLVYGSKGATNAHKKHKERDKFVADNKEYDPASIEKKENEIYSSLETKNYNKVYAKHISFVAQYNELQHKKLKRGHENGIMIEFEENLAYFFPRNSKSSNLKDYIVAGIDRGINMAYIIRSLCIGGVLPLLFFALSIACSSIIFSPLAIGVTIITFAVLFTAVGVINKMYQNNQEHTSINNLIRRKKELDLLKGNVKKLDQATKDLNQKNQELDEKIKKLEENEPKFSIKRLLCKSETKTEDRQPLIAHNDNEKSCSTGCIPWCCFLGSRRTSQKIASSSSEASSDPDNQCLNGAEDYKQVCS